MIFSKRRAYNGRPTIGRSKDGVRLVGFKYQKGYDWLDLNSKQEGVRLAGIKFHKGLVWLALNSESVGGALVGFKYQKGYDWWDSNIRSATIGWIHNSIVRT